MSPAGDSGYFPGRPGNDESKHSSSSGSSGSSSSHKARQDASATAADLEKHEHPIVNCQLSAQETLPTGTSCRSSMSMPMWLASRHTHKTSACCSPPCGGFCTSTRLSLVQEVFQAPTHSCTDAENLRTWSLAQMHGTLPTISPSSLATRLSAAFVVTCCSSLVLALARSAFAIPAATEFQADDWESEA